MSRLIHRTRRAAVAQGGPARTEHGRNAASLFWLFLSAALGACAPQRSLSPFSPCGGKILGTWHIVLSQLDVRTETRASCWSQLDLTKMRLGGLYTFHDDSTYRIDLEAAGDWVIKAPARCGRPPTSCKENEHKLRRLLRSVDEPDHPVTCTGRTECICSHVLDAMPIIDEGTYLVDGTTLQLGSHTRLDYCVAGDQLELRAAHGKGAFGRDDDITGRLMLIRNP
jgi:hypothetical protein